MQADSKTGLTRRKTKMQKRTKQKPAREPETINPAADAQELFERGRRIAGLPPQASTEPPRARTQPTPDDPLRMMIYRLSPEKEAAMRGELSAMILKKLGEMD